MTTYTVPDNPPDPEAAALELIVRLPVELLGHDSPTREALQEFSALLSAEGVFAGMSWHDESPRLGDSVAVSRRFGRGRTRH